METELNNLCSLCKNAPKNYTCPRCNADYCSLTCFQAPSHLECSESFFKSCVLENFPCNDTESRQKVMDLLKEFHSQNFDDPAQENEEEDDDEDCLDSDDDAEGLSLSERLAGVNLDDTSAVWNKLTHDEQQEFEAFLRSGDATKFLPKWEPWWLKKLPKIAEVGETVEEIGPKILEGITKLTDLTSKLPSECVRFNIVNVVSAYVFTARYFNGDHYDFLEEAVGCITYLSLSLKSNQNFDSLVDAIQSVQEQSLTNEWISVDDENIATMNDDVCLILEIEKSDNCVILRILSDIHNLMNTLLSKGNGENDNFMRNCPVYKVTKKDVKLHMKKLEYFLSYIQYTNSNKANALS